MVLNYKSTFEWEKLLFQLSRWSLMGCVYSLNIQAYKHIINSWLCYKMHAYKHPSKSDTVKKGRKRENDEKIQNDK